MEARFGIELEEKEDKEREREREKWCEAETSYLTDPARRQKRRSEKGFKNFPASDCGCSQMLPKDISKNSLVLEFGVPPQLSGFFRAFHPAAPGLNPKYTIDGGFFNLNCDMLKRVYKRLFLMQIFQLFSAFSEHYIYFTKNKCKKLFI